MKNNDIFLFLDQFIGVEKRIARSVNLERDAVDSEQIKRFQITKNARHILTRFIESLEGDPNSSWSLTGPYGSGKSAFCNFLFALCSDNQSEMGKEAINNLATIDPDLQNRFLDVVRSDRYAFLPLRAVSQYESINKTLLRALNKSLSIVDDNSTKCKVLKSRLHRLMECELIPTADLIELLQETSLLTQTKLLIVVDEFGKNLEYLSHHPANGDIFILQALAENTFSFNWVCLHQAFSDYASTLSELQRHEWSKIQGRFEDISYLEPPSRVLSLLSNALKKKQPNIPKRLETAIDQWSEIHIQLMQKITIRGIPRLNKKWVKNLYPFHPLSAIVLGELSHRFAQNDRTIFSFLSGEGTKTFRGYLSHHKFNGESHLPTIGLDWLYDYFCDVTTQVHGNRSTTQRWIEIQSMIFEHKELPFFEKKIIKTIGVLNLLSSISGMKASKKMICVALSITDPLNNEVLSTLDKLVSKGILIYRAYADEYRLWEGSDFDIEKAILEERARLALEPLDTIMEISAPQPPVIAARHSFQTGAVREFAQHWTTLDFFNNHHAKTTDTKKHGDGRIWLVLGKQNNPDYLKRSTKQKPLIVGYAPFEAHAFELALDAAASQKVFETHHQLTHDGIARREARFRAEAANEALNRFLNELKSPTNNETIWYANGRAYKLKPGFGLSALVSTVCDTVYAKSPHVHMEMINHNTLTTAAARAQRELIEAMVAHEREENLGLEGYGPEVAIYRAMFKSTGLHDCINKNNNLWAFRRPNSSNPKQANLSNVWELLDNLFVKAEATNASVELITMLHLLQKPPYGLRSGPIPLFICHYLVVNDDDVAVYQDGIYKPLFGKAEAALMLKRPDLFAFKRFSSSGVRREIVLAYMNALNTDVLQLKETRNQSLLKIIAPLVNFMKGLPDFTQFTRRISLQAQKMRTAVLNAKEPIKLLLHEIPEALDMPPFDSENTSTEWKEDLCRKLQVVLVELYDIYPQLNSDIQHSIITSFGKKSSDLSIFRSYLQKRVNPLIAPCRDKDLKMILRAIMNTNANNDDWARGIAGVILKKPVDAWQDSDLEPWYLGIKEVAERINIFESLVGETQGFDDGNGKRMILSLSRDDGSTQRKIIEVSQKDKEQFYDRYPGLENLSKAEKERLCAILMDDLGEVQ